MTDTAVNNKDVTIETLTGRHVMIDALTVEYLVNRLETTQGDVYEAEKRKGSVVNTIAGAIGSALGVKVPQPTIEPPDDPSEIVGGLWTTNPNRGGKALSIIFVGDLTRHVGSICEVVEVTRDATCRHAYIDARNDHNERDPDPSDPCVKVWDLNVALKPLTLEELLSADPSLMLGDLTDLMTLAPDFPTGLL